MIKLHTSSKTEMKERQFLELHDLKLHVSKVFWQQFDILIYFTPLATTEKQTDSCLSSRDIYHVASPNFSRKKKEVSALHTCSSQEQMGISVVCLCLSSRVSWQGKFSLEERSSEFWNKHVPPLATSIRADLVGEFYHLEWSCLIWGMLPWGWTGSSGSLPGHRHRSKAHQGADLVCLSLKTPSKQIEK